MPRGKRPAPKRAVRKRRPKTHAAQTREGTASLEAMPLRLPPSSVLTGGDVDTDSMQARDSGEEAVGGSVATPDQDIVDDLGRALGVPQGTDDEVRTSGEILRERDRHRWRQES